MIFFKFWPKIFSKFLTSIISRIFGKLLHLGFFWVEKAFGDIFEALQRTGLPDLPYQCCQIFIFFPFKWRKNYDRDLKFGVISFIQAEKFIGDIFEALRPTGLPDFCITGLPDIHLSIYFHKNKGRGHQSW